VVVDPSGRAVFGPHAMLSGRPDGMPGDIIADDSGRAVSEIMRAFRIRFLRSTYSVAIPGSAGKSGFLFDKLPPGEYVLEIEAKGYKAYSAKIRVSKQDHVQHVAKLTLEDVALTGTVTDSAGRALSGAQVSVHTDGSTHTGYLSTATRPDGTGAGREEVHPGEAVQERDRPGRSQSRRQAHGPRGLRLRAHAPAVQARASGPLGAPDVEAIQLHPAAREVDHARDGGRL
jgi:hypothetical protein